MIEGRFLSITVVLAQEKIGCNEFQIVILSKLFGLEVSSVWLGLMRQLLNCLVLALLLEKKEAISVIATSLWRSGTNVWSVLCGRGNRNTWLRA
jgi:hypothetical protein